MKQPENLRIAATDGYHLASYLYLSENPKAFVLIQSATSVDQRFYKSFANWLTVQGYHVLTFDYRGIAQSRPQKLNGFKADYHDWAAKDCASVVDYIKQNYPVLPLYLIGHSIGGALIGMMPNSHQFDAIITVAAQTAYYKDWEKSQRRKIYWLWHGFFPLITSLVGYFPGKRLKMLEDTPKGIMLDWHARRLFEDYRAALLKKQIPVYFDRIKAPILCIGLEDDPIGTAKALERMHQYYENTSVSYQYFSPKDIQVKQIGHFNLFRKQFESNLWQVLLDWLDKQRKS